MARLGDICEILDSKRVPITATERQPGPYPYYGANGVQDYVADYIFDDDLVLLAEDGGNFGSKDKPIAYRVSGKCWVNNHAHVLKPKEGLNVDYLCYSLMFYDVTGLVNGATRQKLTQADMRKMEIPLPSLDEQRKIAAVLDKVSDLIAKRRQQLDKLDELVQARFVEMFGDPISNPHKWELQSLSNICKDIYGGGTPSKSHPEYFEGSIPWVSPKDMKSDIIMDSIDHITEEAVENSSTKMVPKGAVLMVIRSGILKHTLPVAIAAVELTVNQDMKAFIVGENVTAKFLMYYFRTIEADVLSGVRSVTADNIDFKEFQKRMVILPPIELQNRFDAFVEQTEKTKTTISKSLEKLETLKKALMQEYFG
ncbi:restriction endonuclease subunit S [Negativibacillus massiliensis]|uniref:restriction endonuclease subunit S n=1 Tax=Negativibacillus massiliensis TaxID=1871035 RepID=UPI003AF81C98